MNKNGYPATSIECKITFCKDCCNFIKFDSKLHICPKAENAIIQAVSMAINTESVCQLLADKKDKNKHHVKISQLLFHMYRGCEKFEENNYISQGSKDFAELAAIAEVYKRITKEGEQCKN